MELQKVLRGWVAKFFRESGMANAYFELLK